MLISDRKYFAGVGHMIMIQALTKCEPFLTYNMLLEMSRGQLSDSHRGRYTRGHYVMLG